MRAGGSGGQLPLLFLEHSQRPARPGRPGPRPSNTPPPPLTAGAACCCAPSAPSTPAAPRSRCCPARGPQSGPAGRRVQRAGCWRAALPLQRSLCAANARLSGPAQQRIEARKPLTCALGTAGPTSAPPSAAPPCGVGRVRAVWSRAPPHPLLTPCSSLPGSRESSIGRALTKELAWRSGWRSVAITLIRNLGGALTGTGAEEGQKTWRAALCRPHSTARLPETLEGLIEQPVALCPIPNSSGAPRCYLFETAPGMADATMDELKTAAQALQEQDFMGEGELQHFYSKLPCAALPVREGAHAEGH